MESYKWELNKGRKECKKWESGSGISLKCLFTTQEMES